MLTVAPLTVVLMGIIGIVVIVASVARMFVLEHQVHETPFLADPGAHDRSRLAA
jgi:hypothetical protein